uniref:Uncharacterized protein n=1 Tax=Tanacetum cinerariifolium TaxID=118510 RepID=A0A6L2J1M4_TANCI|nr:hypothetical protein [Tanacetum cinerariifolium]
MSLDPAFEHSLQSRVRSCPVLTVSWGWMDIIILMVWVDAVKGYPHDHKVGCLLMVECQPDDACSIVFVYLPCEDVAALSDKCGK